jgi:anti-sigma factor (TIGR02949 family)
MMRMDCIEVCDLIQAYDDGELPASERAAMADHLQGCAQCAATLADLQKLRATLRASGTFAAPPNLEARVRASLGLEAQSHPSSPWRRYGTLAASHLVALALGATLVATLFSRHDTQTNITRDLVAAHVRALSGDQLIQVASADTHTVKPWFAGKISFAPEVHTLATQDFPLLGGRLDYVLDRPAAAVVYGRRKHRITLFILPIEHALPTGEFQTTRNGYNVVAWSQGSFAYFATSDLNRDELTQFSGLLRSARAQPTPP